MTNPECIIGQISWNSGGRILIKKVHFEIAGASDVKKTFFSDRVFFAKKKNKCFFLNKCLFFLTVFYRFFFFFKYGININTQV